MKNIPQSLRLLFLFLYIAVLLTVSLSILGVWPPFDFKGIWFYSGLAALVIGVFMDSPYYTTPTAAFINSVGAIIAILPYGSEFSNNPPAIILLWLFSLSFVIVVFATSTFTILFKDNDDDLIIKITRTTYQISTNWGAPRAIFTIVFFFALITFHGEFFTEFSSIALTWIGLVIFQPLENMYLFYKKIKEIWGNKIISNHFGEVVGHNAPNIVTILQKNDTKIQRGQLILVPNEEGLPNIAVALGYLGFSGGRWLRGIQLRISDAIRNELPKNTGLQMNNASLLGDIDIPDEPLIQNPENLIGVVAPNSNISTLQIDIINHDIELSEGRLIKVEIGNKQVLYQIIDGITKEEILSRKNARGYILTKARKIGEWDNEKRHFNPIQWVPAPNEPVFLIDESDFKTNADSVGHFPNTSYSISVSPSELVTHNTAILGILGVGKTYLAFELIERLLDSNMKVICLDITDQYASELDMFDSTGYFTDKFEKLQEIGSEGKDNHQKHVEESGSINEFKEALFDIVQEFLKPDHEGNLLIINPSQFEVWRQDSKPYKGEASMASLSPSDITSFVTECALEVLQNNGMTTEAKCCVVFEEAHVLVPEWNSVAIDSDREATNRTSRAILQGRKYGLGCLVVTQRTANVTKTILNQCNTIFAMRSYDATGLSFLASYIGEDYTKLLNVIEERHAILFGKASTCRDPVLIRLNDREDFTKVYRDKDDAESTELASTSD